MATVSAAQAFMLPNDRQAEDAIIGSVLLDPSAIHECQELDLRAADFYGEVNAQIYAAMQRIAERGGVVEYLALCQVLGGEIDNADTMLAGIISHTVTSAYAGHYAQIVKDHARRRRVIAAAADIAAQAHRVETPVDEMLAAVSARFFEAADVTEDASHLIGSDDVIEAYLVNQQARAEALKNNPNALLRTGMPSLDALLGDIEPGQFIVVGARTSIGKTAFMESVSENAALRGKRVAYYHLELSHQKMLDRQFARYSGVPIHELRQGYDGPRLHRNVEAVRDRLCNMIYVHCPGWTAERVAADAAQLMARHGLDLIVVDYLGKLAYPQGARGMNEAGLISQQVECIKNISERLGVPVIMGSQVSRDFKHTGDKRPTVNDLKGSGEIENRAQKVVMLHRPNERVDGADSEVILASIEKNEDGPCGQVELRHLLGRFRIVDTLPEPVEEQVQW